MHSTRLVYSDSSVIITLRSDLRILTARWSKPMIGVDIQQGYWCSLEIASKEKVRFWLLDPRGRGPGGENDYWVLNTFLPAVKSSFDRKVFIAYLLSPSHFDVIMPRIPHEELKKLTDNFSIAMFTHENHAVQWLEAMQRADAQRHIL